MTHKKLTVLKKMVDFLTNYKFGALAWDEIELTLYTFDGEPMGVSEFIYGSDISDAILELEEIIDEAVQATFFFSISNETTRRVAERGFFFD